MTIAHDTLTFDRRYDASPSRVWAAYADTRAREAWSAPTDTAEVSIDSVDFRSGGRETARCGTRGDMKWRLELTYHAVVPERTICFSEELWEGEMLLTVALISFEFEPDGAGSRVRVTDQVASFVGGEGIEGHGEGYAQALDKLGRMLVPA
ncbi:hypothetical protein HKCCE2091_20435 [Rhodobacterales bacterium HKCCE2091]|nr:hypothetical protein [Rhodobacterales bacterium HKCCE2091]